MELLRVDNLEVQIQTERGVITPVANVSFSVNAGETIGIVGESGSGKSVTALTILQLMDRSISRVSKGQILFQGNDLSKYTEKDMRKIRGDRISMIFQEPMTSLNPVFTIGYQIMEPLIEHQKLSKKQAEQKAIALLKEVRIPEPEKRLVQYPHQLSGGMRQRIMIAVSLACSPALLIADEPTTALDVTVQAQILELIKELSKTNGMSVMLITHDLGVVAEVCDKVIVMYAGQIVESAYVNEIFNTPQHPYTRALLKCIPTLDTDDEELFVIEGNVPSPKNMPKGCRFQDRCPHKTRECEMENIELKEIAPNHYVRCVHSQPLQLRGANQ
ncbi:ABC transporter ATP-binding protein [Paenibacillus filicis]|uniref:ABC transporter ATP-binding protein n=1 Tax=Paenibacillus gyeongsangnamensis TaxID=3388067 RepID=A0ABT4Q3R4_9BACL|nr:ABC transporter ATP-binding protein [Paenibacillus filicis]MCZ8511519.1 ABC transporter ATP-binding protein [Paenibacillus filicis]